MRADTRLSPMLLQPNGEPALCPQCGSLLGTYECVVLLDGQPCEVVAADEEAGVVEAYIHKQELAKISALDLLTGVGGHYRFERESCDLGSVPPVTQLRQGKVEIRCECLACRPGS